MRFVITGEWSRNRLLRLILALYLIYVALYVVTAALMFFDRMGLDPSTVAAYYLGDVDSEFGRPARPYSAMIQDAHMHMFATGLLVLLLTHLLLFVPLANGLKFWLTVVTYGATLMNEACNWLVRFVSAKLAILKVISFLAMEVSLTVLCLIMVIYVARPSKNAYKQSAS